MRRAVDKHLLKSLLGLASLVELRDPYTGGHAWRVGQFSKHLALGVGLDRDQVFLAQLGGFLHDLGKVGIPDAVLRKPDRLTEDEFTLIKTHPAIGSDLLADHPLADLARDAVRHHHERPDGRGYPDGLAGEDCPVVARIVGVADAFDAMTSTRSYRRGMPIDRAVGILIAERGRQFDGTMIDGFVSLYQAGDTLGQIVGHSDHGQKLAVCPVCGPVLTVPRDATNGARLFCRNCGGLYRIEREDDEWVVYSIDAVPDPGALRPYPETDVQDEILQAIPPSRHSFFTGRLSALVGAGRH
ncbi:HD domain-containing phosphohydrolase [Telmatospirillum sp.]|uniref:HD domain-containing phosphohydrolase n=1 Tax=Telmatospirillum sp. TaxID=2079197 RepID=UPI00284E3F16|nr:HD domain-containing phosphohydrolase [Telmatospirillum sp.]MDR3440915.1 HD domain-containing protein [Telmatospirillum sp.]